MPSSARDRDFLARESGPVALSATPITVVMGTISSLNLPAACGGRGALLAAHAVLVLRLARDVVALGHGLGGLQHGPVDLGLVLLQPRRSTQHVAGWSRSARRRCDSTPPATITGTSSDDDALRGHGDGLQAGGAEAVDGDAGGGHRAAGAQRDLRARCCRRWCLRRGRSR